MNIQRPYRYVSSGFDRATFISNTSNAITTNTSITLTKPNDIVTGDLLIILVGNDDITSLDQWDNTTNKPTGFTFIQTDGTFNTDCHYGSFWRVADGTEGATINITSSRNANYYGFYIHIKGAHVTAPIGNLGASALESALTTNTLGGITGNADDLGIYINSFDGGDGLPFSVSGSGWVLDDEVQVSTSGLTVSGSFGTKIYSSTAAQDTTITASVPDGQAGFQFRIISA